MACRLAPAFGACVVLLHGCGFARDQTTTTPSSSTASGGPSTGPFDPDTTDTTTTTSRSKTTTTSTTSAETTTTSTTSAETATTSTTSSAAGLCNPLMRGIDCAGADLKQVHADTPEHCCELCSKLDGCGAFTHRQGSCFLKTTCQNLRTDWENGRVNMNLVSSTLVNPPPTPPPSCAVPALGQNFKCQGAVVRTESHVEHSGECCDKCMQTEECLIFTHDKGSKNCTLFHDCPEKTAAQGYTTGWAPPKQTQTGPKFDVGRGWYEITGYKCGGQKSTVVFYPKGAGPFHVVVYGHGAWGEIDGSDAWLETVASLGLIVIAPFAGKDTGSCGKAFADDLLNAISGSKAGGASLHPALATADWSRTGLLGHSKGGKYTALAAKKQTDHNIKAFVSSCDVPSKQYDIETPAMFTTGTLDKFDVHNQSLAYFQKYTGRPKVYTSLEDAYHMEVQEGMRLNILTAQFLSCHVSERHGDCDVIYGTGRNSLCELNDYAPGGCLVVADVPTSFV